MYQDTSANKKANKFAGKVQNIIHKRHKNRKLLKKKHRNKLGSFLEDGECPSLKGEWKLSSERDQSCLLTSKSKGHKKLNNSYKSYSSPLNDSDKQSLSKLTPDKKSRKRKRPKKESTENLNQFDINSFFNAYGLGISHSIQNKTDPVSDSSEDSDEILSITNFRKKDLLFNKPHAISTLKKAKQTAISRNTSLVSSKPNLSCSGSSFEQSFIVTKEDNTKASSNQTSKTVSGRLEKEIIDVDDDNTSVPKCNSNSKTEYKSDSSDCEIISDSILTTASDSMMLNNSLSAQNTNNVKYLDLLDSKLIILSGDAKISFYGLAILHVLCGKIEIFGFLADSSSGELKVYSPRGSSLLYLKNVVGTNEVNNTCSELLDKFKKDFTNININPGSSIIMCKKLNDITMTFIEKHISQQLFPRREQRKPQCVFGDNLRDARGNLSVISTSEQWNTLLNLVSLSTKMFICGGKGVGKSTFLRFAINSLLKLYNMVCVVDLDPGQSEFTVPGCLSIVIVKEPLLGPNYTHLQKPVYSVMSDINVGHDPKKYLNSIKHLVSKLDNNLNMPTLINYMGFSKDIGLNIASAAITIIQPTDVLMIQSDKAKNNFKCILTPEVVNVEASLLLPVHPKFTTYNLVTVQSLSDGTDGWTVVPRQLREMCILAYFGKMVDATENTIFSEHAPIFETSLSSVKLVNLKGQEVSPMAVNANLVALCSEYSNQEFSVCGWGLVRGIDPQKDVIVLSTPVEPDVLESVCYLVIGSVNVPPSIIMTTDNVIGLVPYVHEGELPGQIVKRTYIPANKK